MLKAEVQVFFPSGSGLLVMMVSTPESITLDPTMHAKSATKYIVINHPKWLITSDPYDRK